MRRIGAAVALCAALGCNKVDADPEKTTATTAPVVAPPTEKPPEPTLTERVMAEPRLWVAISALKPQFEDTTNGAPAAGLVLSAWGAKHMKWSELTAIPETKFALVMKDSEAERGKRLCASGTVVEIAVDRSAGNPIYLGGLMTPAGKVLRFAAVGSTGELVANSAARICGIVVGRESYANSAGGATHAVFVSGMFDLPENKTK